MRLAEEIGDHWGLDRVYVNLTDALTMLGRPGSRPGSAPRGSRCYAGTGSRAQC